MAALNGRARELLEGQNYAFLAVEDDGPHVSPVWVHTDGEHVLVNTAVGRVKERAMHEGGRRAVGLAADDPYEHVDIRGRVVRRVEGDEAVEHINELARKYRGPESTFSLKPGERRVKVWIEPTVVA